MLKWLLQKVRGAQPAELPGYAAQGVIREGSMSVIFKAREHETGRMVAVKVHKPGVKRTIDKRESRFRDFTEGQITASFDHVNVIKCLDHGDLGGRPYLVLEYLEGMTLANLTGGSSKRLAGQRLACIRQAAAALAHVHAQRFVHHDVCAKNLFVTNENRVKLIDFVLATPLLDTPAVCTRTGTVDTLAPEVLRREVCDQRVDVFAWGVVAYQVLSGHWPFESPDHHQTLSKILNVHPVPLARRVSALPEEIASLIMRCLDKDPAKRLSSMSTAVGVLERHKACHI